MQGRLVRVPLKKSASVFSVGASWSTTRESSTSTSMSAICCRLRSADALLPGMPGGATRDDGEGPVDWLMAAEEDLVRICVQVTVCADKPMG